MAKKATPAPNPRLDQVLGLATDTAKGEHGGAESKKVTAAATLNVTSVEGTKTTTDGVEAAVTLGTSHSETDTAATS